MIKCFDRIVIAVPNLEQAIDEYETLLGARFWPLDRSDNSPAAWLGLANVVIELREQAVASPQISALAFVGEEATGSEVKIQNSRGLDLSVCDGGETARFRAQQISCQNSALKVDHVVLRSADADACLALFSVGLGIRLALDQEVPEWGGRMLFFRVGQLTLEVIAPSEDKPEFDHFWGITYQCPDIGAKVGQLQNDGLAVSDIRDGRKPGTQVATLKSHVLSIPTLLIAPCDPV